MAGASAAVVAVALAAAIKTEYRLLRVLLVFGLFCACSYGFGEHIKTFQAAFTQHTRSQDNTLVYSGRLYVKSPAKAKWVYDRPTQKEIYISDDKAIVYEPLLDQASIGQAKIDFLKILQQAAKQPDGSYVTDFEGTHYTLLLEKDLPKKLAFIDELDNAIEIIFSNVRINAPISDDEFVFVSPPNIDMIENP